DEVLDEAITQCRAAGRFEDWVQKTVPALAETADEITAKVLIESAPYPIDGVQGDEPEPIPLRWIFYTRDVAAMTPGGLVLSRFINQDRIPEPALVRLALDWSPTLGRCPVAFDALKAKVNVQGGDIVVVDDKTLFLGVGSLTDIAAAPKLARALKMDVVTVQLPPDSSAKKWYGLRKLFLHLDTTFGLLDTKMAVTVPYAFESKFAERHSLEQMTRACRKLPGGESIEFRKTMRILRDVGRVRRFVAGSGEPDPRVVGMKLVDYLRSVGYRLVFVGGEPPPAVDAEFFRSRLLPELRAQAANVVALGPGRVIAYAENSHTLRALGAAGIDVQTFPGSALARWHGGPHCLTLPLERG
ncbi:MAG: arginine deiminase family protein, partial [Isosphaeraceae bacterium]|nr:arginine deiminase family protein [Isosphaeraceae bacterium]